MSALEESIRKYAEESTKSVVRPTLGLTFDSLGEAYDFYNLYSWEIGFGIRYGKSRLNAERTKCMQEIVRGCSGKPEAENSRSCRCECPALIRLLRAADNSWYITEHLESHNHSMSLTMGEKVHWPSHKHIDVYTKDLIKQLRENNINLGKVYSIIGSFFGSVEKVPFTKRTLRNICGKISREQADDDVRKTLEAFADILAGDPGFTYRVLTDNSSKVKNLMWANGSSRMQYRFFGDTKSQWGEKYPPSVGLYHVEPSDQDIRKFNTNMKQCPDGVLEKKWFKHFHPILAVVSGKDLKDELTPGGELTVDLMRCIQRMLSAKEKRMYRGWLDRWRGIFILVLCMSCVRTTRIRTGITSTR